VKNISKWHLVADNELVDTVNGTYSAAARKKNKLEKENDWKIIIYQSF